MKRRHLLVALLVILAVPLLAARAIEAVEDDRGVWSVSFWSLRGSYLHALSAEEYEGLRRARACRAQSHFTKWPTTRELQLVCVR